MSSSTASDVGDRHRRRQVLSGDAQERDVGSGRVGDVGTDRPPRTDSPRRRVLPNSSLKSIDGAERDLRGCAHEHASAVDGASGDQAGDVPVRHRRCGPAPPAAIDPAGAAPRHAEVRELDPPDRGDELLGRADAGIRPRRELGETVDLVVAEDDRVVLDEQRRPADELHDRLERVDAGVEALEPVDDLCVGASSPSRRASSDRGEVDVGQPHPLQQPAVELRLHGLAEALGFGESLSRCLVMLLFPSIEASIAMAGTNAAARRGRAASVRPRPAAHHATCGSAAG